jgi:PPIC-type PPIASE domain
MKLLRDPLLHFLLLGAIVFAVYSLVSRHRTDNPGEIVVTSGKVENLAIGFARTWQRPPSEQELQGLIRDYVREEVAYREALAMGLDRDDTIIRRRLQQKLEFVSENGAARAEPTDAELETYLQSHSDNFKTETTLTFHHVYLNPQAHSRSIADDTVRTLAKLRRDGENADINTNGDPFVLEHQFERIPVAEVSKMFGQQFSSALLSLPLGQWQGPIQSGFGTHLVFVSERAEGHAPALKEIRAEVQREWAHTKRVEAENRFYQGLLERYTVRIEPLEEKRMAEVRQ